MSGFKRATVSISQEEYDRLREAEKKMKSLPETSTIVYTNIAQQSTDALQSDLEIVQRRQQQFDMLISQMNDTIRDLESSTAQSILDYQTRAIAEAQKSAGDLWNHVNQKLNEQAAFFEEQIAATHQHYQDQLAQYSHRVRRIVRDQEQKRALAQEWLDAAEQFCEFIKQNYQHEAFAPGQVDLLERQLQQARQNLEVGLSEAVIVTAQHLYSAFSDLRVNLEYLEHEWKMLLQTAYEATGETIGLAEESQVVSAVDMDGNPLPFEIDVDYWSDGQLSELRAEIINFKCERLESVSNLPDSETLQHWLQIDLPAYVQKLEEIVHYARVMAINSQLRFNIARFVVKALQSLHFSAGKLKFEGNDHRDSCDVRLWNKEKNEIIVKIVPTGPQLGQNELCLQSLDSQERNDHELKQRWNEICTSLAEFGLSVGPYTQDDAGEYAASPQPAQPSKTSLFTRIQESRNRKRLNSRNGH